jgi:5-epi-alpha-selinene synthase
MLNDIVSRCPFPSELSPHADAVEHHSERWAFRFGLASTPSVAARLRAGRYGRLAARVYPRGELIGTTIAGDWITWLFLFDDLCDEQQLGREPARLEARTRRLAAAHVDEAFAPTDPFERAIANLGRRFRSRANPESWQRLRGSIEGYFGSLVWEAENRAAHRSPTTDEYIAMRPLTSAMTIVFDIADVTDGIDLAASARQNKALAELARSANYVVCWTNDIVSATKESAAGDVHNLVLAMCAERGLAVDDAIREASAKLDAEIERYLALEASVRAIGTRIPSMARYLAMLRSWMRGYMDWVLETRRYGDVSREAPPALTSNST